MKIPEAKKKLEAWRDLLKEILQGVTPGPWGQQVWNKPSIVISCKDKFVCQTVNGNDEKNANFFVLSIVAIPAMLAGIEVALGGLELASRQHPNKEAQYTCVGISGLAIQIIEAYEPYFKEAQGQDQE